VEARWTVEELVNLSQTYISHTGSRRVRWNPNPRLIRYYTSLGLLDRPFGVRGHTVYYGRRHLLQLLAIKALQSEGEPLAAIQERLQGLPDADLRSFAQLPDDWQTPQPEATRDDFWRLAPSTNDSGKQDLPLQGVTLAPGVILLLDTSTHTNIDLASLKSAAQPLISALRKAREETL
jgi:DNA-binding transcriptional MerR regulator